MVRENRCNVEHMVVEVNVAGGTWKWTLRWTPGQLNGVRGVWYF